MKRALKTSQRKKQLNRQHHKISSRRLSHFNQAMSKPLNSQNVNLSSNPVTQQ